MEAFKNIFTKIDHELFKKIDLLKNDGTFLKINDFLSTLTEEQHKAFAQIVAFSFILIPYIFVISFWLVNSHTKKRIEIKTQILEQISLLHDNKIVFENTSSQYLAASPIKSQDDLNNKIKSIMSMSNISSDKVNVVNFNQVSTTSSIAKEEAALKFKNFGTQDFALFMKALVETEKFKITKFKIAKDQTTSLLQGEVYLMHLGKNSAN